MSEPIIRTKAKYRFLEFLRPRHSWWPYPYTIEQAFGLYAWMAETSLACFKSEHNNPVHGLLAAIDTTVHASLQPVRSIDHLRDSFHCILLSDVGQSIEDWKTKHGIGVYAERWVHFRHHQYGTGPDCEAGLKTNLDLFLKSTGKLAVQLNEHHADANNILGVTLRYSTYYHGWIFQLRYGVDGSAWYHELAIQDRRETFYECFARARCELVALASPDYQKPPEWAFALSENALSLTTRSPV